MARQLSGIVQEELAIVNRLVGKTLAGRQACSRPLRRTGDWLQIQERGCGISIDLARFYLSAPSFGQTEIRIPAQAYAAGSPWDARGEVAVVGVNAAR